MPPPQADEVAMRTRHADTTAGMPKAACRTEMSMILLIPPFQVCRVAATTHRGRDAVRGGSKTNAKTGTARIGRRKVSDLRQTT